MKHESGDDNEVCILCSESFSDSNDDDVDVEDLETLYERKRNKLGQVTNRKKSCAVVAKNIPYSSAADHSIKNKGSGKKVQQKNQVSELETSIGTGRKRKSIQIDKSASMNPSAKNMDVTSGPVIKSQKKSKPDAELRHSSVTASSASRTVAGLTLASASPAQASSNFGSPGSASRRRGRKKATSTTQSPSSSSRKASQIYDLTLDDDDDFAFG